MVSFRPFLVIAPLILAAGLFSACEDPSAVGLELVGTEGGTPTSEPVAFRSFAPLELERVLGNFTTFVVGAVDDPAFGRIESSGYLDFQGNLVLSTAYQAGPLDALLLRLDPSISVGDTSQVVTLALHEVLEEFNAIDIDEETLPPVGPEITRFTYDLADDNVVVSIPLEYFAGRDTMFHSLTMATSFHGFQLRPVAGDALVSFFNTIASETTLRGVVDADTVDFLAVRGVTAYVPPTTGGTLAPGLTVLRQGVGPHLRFDFDLSAFEGEFVNRAGLQITLDTLWSENDPSGFVRPELEDLALHGVLSDTTSVLLALGTLRSDGVTLDFDSASFASGLQSVLLGADPFLYYELRFLASAGNTLGAVVFNDSTTTTPPILYLTTTALE